MSVPRGANITDMTARMAASYVPRRATASVAATGTATWTDPLTGDALPGGLFYPGDRTEHTLTVQGTFSATVALQGSQDNVAFQTLTPDTSPAGSESGGAITADGVFVYHGAYRSLRITCTAYSSGTAVMVVDSARS